ncbi:MAG: hypothetical protein QOI40_1437, partial [Alphaproteobacteria bacterium]|nr:hypothetical protein [Alphaproteobacteria bacterium]
DSRGMFHNAREFVELYPEARSSRGPAVYCAPRVEDGYEFEAARRQIDSRAGLPGGSAQEAGPLRGHVDKIRLDCIAGWAQNIDHPEAPVCLDIYVDGALIVQTLANRYRADLEQAGLGSGRHSFEVMLPPGLTVSPGAVEVRRALDGTPLTRSWAFGPDPENRQAA